MKTVWSIAQSWNSYSISGFEKILHSSALQCTQYCQDHIFRSALLHALTFCEERCSSAIVQRYKVGRATARSLQEDTVAKRGADKVARPLYGL